NYIQRAGRAGRRVDTTAYALTFAQRRSHDLVHFYQPWRMVEGQIQAPYVTLDNEKIIRRHIYATALAMFWSEYRKFYGTVESFYFNEKGSGVDHFQAFLGRQPRKLEEALKRIVPVHMHEVLGISDWSWTKELFEEKNSPMQKARYILESDINEINELIEQLVKKRRYVDNLIRLSQTILSKNIIESMSTSNILPKYGFPVDVVELSLLHHGEEAKRLQLERDLRLALSEYAPSSKVVAGGKIWTSRYIKALPNRAWEKYRYAICEYCHSYHRIREEFVDAGAKFDVCPLCKQPFGRRKKTFLIPAFGFIADTRAPDKPGEKKPERMYSTRVYYSGEADEENCVRINMGYTEVELISASHGKLAVINTGKGKGFKVCHRCGYSALIDEKAASSHKTSMGGECRGTLSGSYSLGHEFETDILRITLNGYRDTREGFWYSLLYAILEGISLALEIDRNDLDGCLYPTAGDRCKPSLILFDDVPGGAGHVKRMSNQKEWLNILKVTLERMEQCECGGKEGNSSCYGCLRNYRNQFCHDVLNRGMVIDFLKTLI
ncbi:MAG: DUF1998 domain-containing protein, partial [Clostridiaceae bacterium]|nr:DUF1998 domain-containing protein [Clostridiaceae bacterium]